MKRSMLFILISLALTASAFADTSSYGNITAAGSTCATSSCIMLPLPSGTSTVSISVLGTFSATLAFEVTADDGTWYAVSAYPIPSGTAVTSTTSTGLWVAQAAGMLKMRVRASAYTSGTAQVVLTASAAAYARLFTAGTGLPSAPAGSLQYNSGGLFGGDANLTWDAAAGLAVGKPAAFAVGTIAEPAISFIGDLSTGFYHVGTGNLGMTLGGVLAYHTTGTDNIFLGRYAGNLTTTGIGQNVGIGNSTLYNLTTGYLNLGIGYYSLNSVIDGARNTAMGAYALSQAVSTTRDSAFGSYALYMDTGLGYNTAMGYSALYSTKAGKENTGVGFYTGVYNRGGNYNTYIGTYAGEFNTNGSYMLSLGHSADWYVPVAIGSANVTVGGSVDAGYHFYKVSYVLNGAETALSETLTVLTTSANKTVGLVDIPVYSGPLTCTARNIYRTKAGAYTQYLVTAIADNSTTTYSDTAADSTISVEPTDPSYGMMFGANAKAFFSSTLVLGSTTAPVTDLYFGQGFYSASPAAVAIHATGKSGTNSAGVDLVLAGGQSTGSGAGGQILFQTSTAGGAGSTFNALTTKMTLTGSGVLSFPDHGGYGMNFDPTSGYIRGHYILAARLYDADNQAFYALPSGTSIMNVVQAAVLKTSTAEIVPTGGSSIPLFLATAIGGAGQPATANMDGWISMQNSAGQTVFVPVWK